MVFTDGREDTHHAPLLSSWTKESIPQFRISGRTEPCPDHLSLAVNSAHELHLLASLSIVLLVDAYCVDLDERQATPQPEFLGAKITAAEQRGALLVSSIEQNDRNNVWTQR